MKRILVLVMFVGLLFTSCSDGWKENGKENKANAELESQYELVDDYTKAFQKYLLNKYDGTSWGDVFKPSGIVKLKYENPELYELEIAPMEHVWDSISLVSKNVAQTEGMSESMMKYKDKSRARVKVKKSDNVTINMNNEVIKPDTIQ